MYQADTDHTLFREHFCKFRSVSRLRYRKMWLQFTVIDGELWFQAWDLIDALGGGGEKHMARLFSVVRDHEMVTVYTHRGRGTVDEAREIGGFISYAGARRMAEALRARVRRERFLTWLNAELLTRPQSPESVDGSGRAEGAPSPNAAAATRGRAFVPLSGRERDSPAHPGA